MSTIAGKVECLDCSAALPVSAATSGEPCPACGSMRRHVLAFADVATGTGTAHGPSIIAKRPGGRGLNKPAWERKAGPSPRADGTERYRVKEIDRDRDCYEETVTDPDGTVHHHQSQPLSEHTCHGSDKPKA